MIELCDLTIHAGRFALTNVQASIPAGNYCVLMGRTGQGKTTILEAICGLRRVANGHILLGGQEVTRAKPANRNVGYVPQDLALFPTMTVRGHLEFALRVRRLGRKDMNERVEELAHALGIEALLERPITHLSGGEAQRVALGRALSFRPRVLLLDEPLNALDEITRDRLCGLLRSLQKTYGLTTLHVTHNRAEARHVADQLLVLHDGRIHERPLGDLDLAGVELPEETVSGRRAD